jgi:hypothetical protein
MGFPALTVLLAKSPPLVIRVVHWLLTGLLGAAVLGWVANHLGPVETEVFIHAMERDVDVSVDGLSYHIEGKPLDPIVCHLRAGTHTLVMSRLGRELYREEFVVVSGENTVITAWATEAAGPEEAGAQGPAESRHVGLPDHRHGASRRRAAHRGEAAGVPATHTPRGTR